MEYIVNRPVLNENKSQMNECIRFNLWKNRQFPYRDLKQGDIIYWGCGRDKKIKWKSKVVELEKFNFTSRAELDGILKERFSVDTSNESYIIEEKDFGYCLVYKTEVIKELDINRDFNIGQLGWKVVDDKLSKKLSLK